MAESTRRSDRLRVLVLFGGASEEHDVSLKSASEVHRALDEQRFEILWARISRSGAWRLCEGPADTSPGIPAVLSPDRETQGLLVADDEGLRMKAVDVALPVLHGRFGEDGAIQGLLELAGTPYIGCDVAGSAICMDKSLAYTLARAAGLATPEFVMIRPDDAAPADLDVPVFVKPARSGSSFGVSRVDDLADLPAAIAEARRYDDTVLIEQAIAGAEVGCAVLGDDNEIIVGEIDRITLSHGFFRIHQEDAPETGSENAEVEVPALLPAETRDRIRATARDLYRALRCRGLARVDMFLQDDGAIVLNEVNTMPGLTSYSRYPAMMAAAGLSLADVLERSIRLAMERSR